MRGRAVRLPPLVLACLGAAAAGAETDLNLGFETLDTDGVPLGWAGAGAGATVTSDGSAATEGQLSLKVTRTASAGVTRLAQRIPAATLRVGEQPARARRLLLRGSVRVNSAAAAPAIWLRIDGPAGPLFLDSYGYGREPSADSAAAVDTTGGVDGGWRQYEVELPLPDDVDEVAFGVAVRGQGSAWFDALELRTATTDSRAPAAPAAVRYLDAALALMREHSLRRADVNWPAVRAASLEHARGAVTPADTHIAVRFAVRELGDRHSYLQSARVSRGLTTAAVSNARTGAPLTPPQGRRLAGNLAYLNVPGFAGGTPAQQLEFAETLSSIIQAHDAPGACGWIVDLRQNSGGNLWPMLAGLGPLLGDGDLAASVYPDGRRVAVWHRAGQAGFGDYTQLRVRFPYRVSAGAPVAVLLGPGTASSAEVLAVAVRSRALTRSFGAPTRGLSAGNRTFALGDGASLVLTVAATSDAEGRVVTGPLIPDQPIGAGVSVRLNRSAGASVEPNRNTGTVGGGGAAPRTDAALDAATAWLAASDSCR